MAKAKGRFLDFAGCFSAVQVSVGYWIGVHLAPQTRGELKGAAVLAIVPGYAVGTALFLLLRKLEPRQGPD